MLQTFTSQTTHISRLMDKMGQCLDIAVIRVKWTTWSKHDSMWCLHVLSKSTPKDMHDRLLCDAKLSLDVNVREHDCVSLCVGPAMDWRPGQGEHRSQNASVELWLTCVHVARYYVNYTTEIHQKCSVLWKWERIRGLLHHGSSPSTAQSKGKPRFHCSALKLYFLPWPSSPTKLWVHCQHLNLFPIGVMMCVSVS